MDYNEIDKKIKELCPDAFAAYAVIDKGKHGEEVLIVPSEELAIWEANDQWECLTESEQEGRTITAGIVAGYHAGPGEYEAYPELENGDILSDVYEIFIELKSGK